jgi:hypothetical protein
MNLKNIFLGILIGTIALAGCDEIVNPIFPKQNTSSLPSGPPTYIDSSATTGQGSYTNYKVLLEDCTAHKCSNCPAAGTEAEVLLASNLAPQIVFMEDNMGTLAGTAPVGGYPDTAFRVNYVCTADSVWNNLFGIATIGLPNGMINRINDPTTKAIYYTNWQTVVQAQINANHNAIATINIHDSCWVPERILGCEFQVHFNQTLSGNYLLVTGIVEDSIIDWQLDNTQVSGADIYYNHHFVLRGTFDVTGTGITISPTTAGSTYTSYQTYDFTKGEHGKAGGYDVFNKPWNMAHCYIVAFVYNGTTASPTQYQVVQAEMIKME